MDDRYALWHFVAPYELRLALKINRLLRAYHRSGAAAREIDVRTAKGYIVKTNGVTAASPTGSSPAPSEET